MHPGEMPTGTFRFILKPSSLTEEDFKKL